MCAVRQVGESRVIRTFKGRWRFLSNFYPSIVPGPDNLVCETVEHAFQAWKSNDRDERRRIAGAATAARAKQLGRACQLRGDWDEMKLGVMKSLLDEKFEFDNELGEALLGTTGYTLIEGNTWGDTFWGVCNGIGENWLGRLLMLRRSELWLKL